MAGRIVVESMQGDEERGKGGQLSGVKALIEADLLLTID